MSALGRKRTLVQGRKADDPIVPTEQPREGVEMSFDTDEWAQVKQAVAKVVAARPDGYAPSVVRTLDDLLAYVERTDRPAPSVLPGYWPTFLVEWEAQEASNLQIEVFDDRYEVSRFFDGKTDIWYEPHAPGSSFSDAFIAELPNPN